MPLLLCLVMLSLFIVKNFIIIIINLKEHNKIAIGFLIFSKRNSGVSLPIVFPAWKQEIRKSHFDIVLSYFNFSNPLSASGDICHMP